MPFPASMLPKRDRRETDQIRGPSTSRLMSQVKHSAQCCRRQTLDGALVLGCIVQWPEYSSLPTVLPPVQPTEARPRFLFNKL